MLSADVYGHELTDAPRRGGPGVCRRFHCADAAAHHHGHIAPMYSLPTSATSAVFTIASAASKTLRLDQSQGFKRHACQTLTDCQRYARRDDERPSRSGRGRSQKSIHDSSRRPRRFRSHGRDQPRRVDRSCSCSTALGGDPPQLSIDDGSSLDSTERQSFDMFMRPSLANNLTARRVPETSA